jgi:hypothetical protein
MNPIHLDTARHASATLKPRLRAAGAAVERWT